MLAMDSPVCVQTVYSVNDSMNIYVKVVNTLYPFIPSLVIAFFPQFVLTHLICMYPYLLSSAAEWA